MVALRFGLSGARVGYAAVVMNRQRHPDSNGTSRADYLVVWMMGVDKTFHGMADPGSASGATIADAVMKACDLVAQANGAVGVSLWVREANHRARRLYGRNAFREDPRGVFLDKRGVAMLEMRKLLAP